MTSIQHLIPEFERWRKRYPDGFESSLTIPCLHRIQAERGYVADSDIDELVDYLGVPRIQVEEVLAFYTMFRRAPIGTHHLQVCQNVSCSMRGAERMLDHLHQRLGITAGETTPDGTFTLSRVECLGSCGTAPMMMVNSAYVENLDAAKLDAMIAELSAGKAS
jgi:NADH-quinone oxidoreductase subunit E